MPRLNSKSHCAGRRSPQGFRKEARVTKMMQETKEQADYNRYFAHLDCSELEPLEALSKPVIVVVDMQNDFVNVTHRRGSEEFGNAFGVTGANMLLKDLVAALAEAMRRGVPVALTRDYHPGTHISFDGTIPKLNPHSEVPYVCKTACPEADGRCCKGIYPPHCVWGTEGARIHADLERQCRECPVFFKGFVMESDSMGAVSYRPGNVCNWNPAGPLEHRFRHAPGANVQQSTGAYRFLGEDWKKHAKPVQDSQGKELGIVPSEA